VSTSRYEAAPGIFVEALFCNGCGHRTEHATEAGAPSEWLICARCAKIEFVKPPKMYVVTEASGDALKVGDVVTFPEAPRGQTRLGSAIEVAMNIVIGFSINWVANLLILPLYGFQVTGSQAFSMGLIFTVIAITRGYVLRRVFNRIRSLHHE
jgi:hypothetical protein